MKKFEAIKTDKNGVTFYSQGALDAKLIIAVDDATKSANIEIQNLKKQLEESNRTINEQNMSIQQLKGNLKEEQQKVRAIFKKVVDDLRQLRYNMDVKPFSCFKDDFCSVLNDYENEELKKKTSAEVDYE